MLGMLARRRCAVSVGQLGFMTSNKQRWLITTAVSILVHTIFCVQAVAAARAGAGSMAANEFFLIAFLPHYMLMYFLPPNWPITNVTQVDWLRVAGKLAVSYPVSLLYGWILGAAWHVVHGIRRRPE